MSRFYGVLLVFSNNLLICWQTPKDYSGVWTTVYLPLSYTQIPSVFITINQDVSGQNWYYMLTKDITVSSFILYQNLKQSWLTIGY